MVLIIIMIINRRQTKHRQALGLCERCYCRLCCCHRNGHRSGHEQLATHHTGQRSSPHWEGGREGEGDRENGREREEASGEGGRKTERGIAIENKYRDRLALGKDGERDTETDWH